ncbi:MAG: glycosyltransferase [Myxococcaceae bacterium]|jgi:glycosyltransferase involved in cell wall biosynthesis|nr:glycosyltransferase [Myxococcaceae bacterium]
MTLVLTIVCVASLAWWGAQGVLFFLGRERIRTTRTLEGAQPPGGWPRLSVVIPARNEAEHLEAALTLKRSSTYPNLELVVVNDRSTDDTGAIAERVAAADPRVRVVHLTALPDGWLGKVHAMAKGLEVCTGEFVLFSDADVFIAPGVFEKVISAAQREALDFLCIFPRIRPEAPLLQASLATMFRVLVLFSRPWAVSDPRSKAAVGVGAFNLVRRSALAKTKGLEWLKLETGDDMALGVMLKASGARCEFFLGGEDVHLEFYPSYAVMMRAVEKNGAAAPAPLLIGAAALLVLLEVGLFAGFGLGGSWALAAALGAMSSIVLAASVARLTHTPTSPSLVPWLGSIPFAFVVARSAVLALVRGGVRWRGTFYPTKEIARGRRLPG